MKSSRNHTGMLLFVYILIGLVLSGIVTVGIYRTFSEQLLSVCGILIVCIVLVALLAFFLSNASKAILKVIGYLLSIVGFSIFVLVFYQIFASSDLVEVYMFFYGSAIAGELLLWIGTAISKGKRMYMGIISFICIAVSVLVLGMGMNCGIKVAMAMLIMLAYLYISTIYYFDYEDWNNMEILEKSGMIFNIVAFFISMYGRYTGSWKR